MALFPSTNLAAPAQPHLREVTGEVGPMVKGQHERSSLTQNSEARDLSMGVSSEGATIASRNTENDSEGRGDTNQITSS